MSKKKDEKSDDEEPNESKEGKADSEDGKPESTDVEEKNAKEKVGDDKGKSLAVTSSGGDQLTTNVNNTSTMWEKAYPKNSFGKKIILPDHATPEERLPPTQPVEGTLDVTGWKKEMPQEMIDDIESIFRNPTEVAQKEAIFNKINKDYIILQAQKEKNRNAAEQANDNADKDMIEQTQGMERYRKRKGRNKDGTTEEALLEVVANRKISRKINYDAMSSIFEEGSFSTSGAVLEDAFGADGNSGMQEV